MSLDFNADFPVWPRQRIYLIQTGTRESKRWCSRCKYNNSSNNSNNCWHNSSNNKVGQNRRQSSEGIRKQPEERVWMQEVEATTLYLLLLLIPVAASIAPRTVTPILLPIS